VNLKQWGTFSPHTILNEISIQIKNGRGKIYPILPDNKLFTFSQIVYLTSCIGKYNGRATAATPDVENVKLFNEIHTFPCVLYL
jgi:hypothetical protein